MAKKIMFNDKYGLTQAVIEGRKTQTRRMFTTYKYNMVDWKAFAECGNDCIITDDAFEPTDIRSLAAYKIGEEVAVAQSYDDIYMEKNAPCPIPDEYRLNAYNKGFNQGHKGWKNKMFVSPDDMPFHIKITNIRVERLQDISDADCLKEGIKRKNERYVIENEKGVCFYTNDVRLAFRYLIDKTCGKGTWDSNPWVFVYSFRLVK